MKLQSSLAALLVGVIIAGCGRDNQSQSDSGTSSSAQNEPKTTVKDVRQEARETVDTTKRYLADNKDEFIASAEKKLQELDARIAELNNNTASLKEDAKAEAAKLLATLNEKRSELNQQLQGLKQTAAEKWTDVKAAFETAFAELEKAYENTKAKLSS
jgi:vacuolar-type H+-ATPase subunit H